jgi:hypothetical protein
MRYYLYQIQRLAGDSEGGAVLFVEDLNSK